MSAKSTSESKKSLWKVTLPELRKKIQKMLKKAHNTLGIFGWIAILLAIVLLSTVVRFEKHMNQFEYNAAALYTKENHPTRMLDTIWDHDTNTDFIHMQDQMNQIRNAHEKALKEMNSPTIITADGQASVTSNYVSTDTKQYSINTRNGKLDGFASYRDIQETNKLTQILKKIGLTVDQKDTKVFFTGTADKLSAVLTILEK